MSRQPALFTPRELRALLRHEMQHDLILFIERCVATVAPATPYLHSWHVAAFAEALRLCLKRKYRRLTVTVPPRSLKSLTFSVAFPAFALGHDPTLRFICASYAQDLALKFGRDARTVMASDWYRDIFPGTRIDPCKNSEGEFETTMRGYRLATALGATMTGRGANFLIIDDPLKPQDVLSEAKRRAVKDWLRDTVVSRLDDKTRDVIIVVTLRVHVDDLVGDLLAGGGWTHLNLPAIAETAQEVRVGPNRVYRRAEGELLQPGFEPPPSARACGWAAGCRSATTCASAGWS